MRGVGNRGPCVEWAKYRPDIERMTLAGATRRAIAEVLDLSEITLGTRFVSFQKYKAALAAREEGQPLDSEQTWLLSRFDRGPVGPRQRQRLDAKARAMARAAARARSSGNSAKVEWSGLHSPNQSVDGERGPPDMEEPERVAQSHERVTLARHDAAD